MLKQTIILLYFVNRLRDTLVVWEPNTKYYTERCEIHVEPDGRWRPAAIWLDVSIEFRSNMENSLSQLQDRLRFELILPDDERKWELVLKFDISYANSVNRGVYMLKQVNFSQYHFDEVVKQPVPIHDVRDAGGGWVRATSAHRIT